MNASCCAREIEMTEGLAGEAEGLTVFGVLLPVGFAGAALAAELFDEPVEDALVIGEQRLRHDCHHRLIHRQGGGIA